MSKASEEKAKKDAERASLIARITALKEKGRKYAEIAEVMNAVKMFSPQGVPWTPENLATFMARQKKSTRSQKPETTSDNIPIVDLASTEQESVAHDAATTDAIAATSSPEPETLPQHDQELTSSDSMADTSKAVTDDDMVQKIEVPEPEKDRPKAAAIDYVAPTIIQGMPPEAVSMLAEFHKAGELAQLMEWWRATKGKGGESTMPAKRPTLKGPEGRINTGLLIDKTLKDRALEAAKRDPAMTGGSLSLLIELLLWRFLGEPAEFLVEE